MSEKHCGRVSDQRIKEGYEHYVRLVTSLPPELNRRLQKYCDEDDRTKAYAIQKALDPWLKKKGY